MAHKWTTGLNAWVRRLVNAGDTGHVWSVMCLRVLTTDTQVEKTHYFTSVLQLEGAVALNM